MAKKATSKITTKQKTGKTEELKKKDTKKVSKSAVAKTNKTKAKKTAKNSGDVVETSPVAAEADSMEAIIEEFGDNLIPVKPKMNVVGKVLAISKNRILVDIDGVTLGVIPAREYSAVTADLKVGDDITAYVMIQENDEGHAVLSLRRADKERYIKELEEKLKIGEAFKVWVKDANRGGLMVAYGNVEGFLPASQLASNHYPRGNTKQILDQLKALVGKEIRVKLLTLEPKEGKVIFSEKEAGDARAEEIAGKYKVGDEINVTITGIVDFGLFVSLGEIEGLVHISEVAWDRIFGQEDLKRRFQVGQEIKAQIISNEAGRIALSVKRLLPDPWQQEIENFKEGQVITGKVTQVSPFGAFVQLSDNITGLMHISEFGVKNPGELANQIAIGDTGQFRIISIDKKERKISLGNADRVTEESQETEPKEKPKSKKK